MKRKGLTPEGQEKLRQSALLHRPWSHATGPITAEGKARAASNGKVRQKGDRSVRELRRLAGAIDALVDNMAALRRCCCG
ncbi:MAG: hypothetical protein FJ271_24705 [Planctomycetes bacterium]|nr:hypothetical protein [Planctomycetota bacterium]